MKENYEEEYVRSVKETLRQDYEILLGLIKHTTSHDHRHLTARNKKEVEIAMHHVVNAYHLALSSNSLIIMRAVDSAFAGALFVGMRCSNPLNVKKFWDRVSRGPAGEESGRSRNKNADVWRVWVRLEITRLTEKNPTLAPADLAENMRANKTAPGNLTCHDRLVRFIRKELKSRKAGKRSSLRLVG